MMVSMDGAHLDIIIPMLAILIPIFVCVGIWMVRTHEELRLNVISFEKRMRDAKAKDLLDN